MELKAGGVINSRNHCKSDILSVRLHIRGEPIEKGEDKEGSAAAAGVNRKRLMGELKQNLKGAGT